MLINCYHTKVQPIFPISILSSLLMQLAYLPDRKRECIIDDDSESIDSEISVDGRSDATNLDELVRDYTKNKRRGMLGWFKLKVIYNLFPFAFSSSSWVLIDKVYEHVLLD